MIVTIIKEMNICPDMFDCMWGSDSYENYYRKSLQRESIQLISSDWTSSDIKNACRQIQKDNCQWILIIDAVVKTWSITLVHKFTKC